MTQILKRMRHLGLPLASAAIRRIPSNRRFKPWCVSYSRRLTNLDSHFNFRTNFCGITWSTRALPDLLTRHLLFEGGYQEDVVRSLLTICKPGCVVFDVGGHHGYMALVASFAAGRNGRVITFEPNPYALKWLKHNLELNDASNVEVMPVAVGAQEGTAALHIQKGTTTWNTSLFRSAIGAGYAVEEMEVEITTIDKFVRDRRLAPNVIKIDIEGSEFLALEGAKDTVATFRPSIIMEFNPEAAAAANVLISDIVTSLQHQGYELSVLKKNIFGRYSFSQREPFSESQHCAGDLCNVLCIPKHA